MMSLSYSAGIDGFEGDVGGIKGQKGEMGLPGPPGPSSVGGMGRGASYIDKGLFGIMVRTFTISFVYFTKQETSCVNKAV